MSNLQEIRAAAFRLPVPQRAELARDLLVSLDQEEVEDANCEDAWAKEALDRAAAFQRGELKASEWQESFVRTRKALEEGTNP